MDISVTSEVMAAMEAAARAVYPKEACGILLGEGARVTQFLGTANVHPTPETHFEIDPQALIHAHKAARQGGLGLIGYFHSHPKGRVEPSATDLAMAAADGAIWAIYGETGDGHGIRFFRLGEGSFAELSIAILPR